MDNVVNMLKSLYKGESVVKKHFLYLLLMILPVLTGVCASIVDKETPDKLLLPLLGLVLILLLLSVVPTLGLWGVGLSFMHDRYHQKQEGIPMVNKDIFKTGLKVFPLYLVWGVYMLIFISVILALCFSPFIISALVGGFNDSNGLGLVLSFFVGIMLFLLSCIGLYLLTPFFSYVSITYAKDFEYTSRLFNPLIIVDFIKKSFKSSVMVALKYILINIVVGFITSIVYGIGFVAILVFFIIFASSLPEDATIYSSPILLVTVVAGTLFMALMQSYLGAMVGLGMTGNLIEVYKQEVEQG